MIAIAAPEHDVAAMLAEGAGIAAVNGPAATVISGDDGPVRAAAAYWAARGVRTRELAVSHAFHSPRIDPVLGPLAEAAAALAYHPPQVPVISAVTGQLAGDADLAAPAYWARQARAAVRFADAITTLDAAHVTTYLEVGPGPALTALTAGILPDAPAVIAAVREPQDEPAALVAALAAAHAHGASPDWAAYYPAGTPAVPLPTYPFQRQSYWLHAPAGPGDLPAAGLAAAGHPLLAAAATLPDGTVLLTGRISAGTAAWLPDHAVLGTVIVPGTALAGLAGHAGVLAGTPHLAELTLQAPLVLPSDGSALRLQVTAGPPDQDGHRPLTIHTQPATPDNGPDLGWTCHATGTATSTPDHQDRDTDPDWDWASTWPPPGAELVDTDGLYDQLAATGLDYGPAFRGLTAAWRHNGRLYTDVTLPDGTTVSTADGLTNLMSGSKPGSQLSVVYVDENGARHSTTVTLTEWAK